jgi:Flp pilus assembly protein TadG
VEFGLVFNAKLVMTGAAREGARRAAVEGGATPGAYECVHRYLALGGIAPEAVSVSITPKQASYGTMIRVSLVYDYPVTSAILRPLLGETVTLTAEVVTRSEKVRGR